MAFSCMHPSFRAGRLAKGAALLVGALTCFLGPAPPLDAQAPAAKYKEMAIPDSLNEKGKNKLEVNEVKKRVRELNAESLKILAGETPLAGNDVRFNGFFQRYVFARLTWVPEIENNVEGVDNFNYLAKERKQLLNVYLQKAKSTESHDHLVLLTLKAMQEIAKDDYHPAARYNAMLIIGELNQKEFVNFGTPTLPEPYPDSVPVLVQTLKDTRQIDVVKIAAWIGLLRYLDWDSQQPNSRRLKKETLASIAEVALEVVNARTPPAGRSLDGHVWMQRRGLEAMAYLGTLTTDVNAAPRIDEILGDSKSPLTLRFAAAEALGQLNLPPATKLDTASTVKKLGELAVMSCQRELKRLDDEKTALQLKEEWQTGATMVGRNARQPGMMQMPERGPGVTPGMTIGKEKELAAIVMQQPYKFMLAKRRIKSQMYSVAIGLEGIDGKSKGIVGLAGREPAVEKFARSIADEVIALRDLTDDVSDLDTLVKEMKARSGQLEDLLKGSPTKPASSAVPGAGPAGAARSDDDLPDAPPATPKAATPKAAATGGAGPAPAKPATTELPE